MLTRSLPSVAQPSFIHLDMARGLAALTVFIGHLRSFVFVGYGDLGTHGPVDTLVWIVTGFGHQAVMMFFVLSGFLITKSILIDDNTRGFSWPIYLIKRLTRLWTVLLPCLILTACWDRLGIFVSGSKFYDGVLYPAYNSGPNIETGGASWTAWTFLQNLLFLQTITSPVFGSNGPLWSLANEFWYYLLFPLLYISITRRQDLMCSAINVAVFLTIGVFIGKYMMLSGLIWLAGAVSYIAYERAWCMELCRSRGAVFGALGLFLISLATSKTTLGTEYTRDVFIGFAAAALVLVLANRDDDGSALYNKLARMLADNSYTIYLVHFPFMAFLINVTLANRRFDASLTGYILFISIGICTLLYCHAIYLLFERQTDNIKKYIIGKYKYVSGRVSRV
jgi:peptidoglycan/LPS O-acetylase OafA/YrhL